MSSIGRPAAASITLASLCAFAMITTQVAGKAARDVLFLTNFPISALPLVLMASAALSIGVVLVTARTMALLGPARVVPRLFVASAVLLVAEWWLAVRYEKPAAVIVYLHIAVIGSILISGFWSIIDEIFDPRTAKRGIGRIVAGATLGGLFGGLLAERVGARAGILWVIPVIAAFQVGCAWLLPRLTRGHDAPTGTSLRDFFARRRAHHAESGFRVLRRVGYLRGLALIVLLGNVAATLIDYVFKAHATASYPDDAALVRFFALFYTAVSVLTLAVQTGMTRRLLEGVGIANTASIRPALVTVGGLAALPATGLVTLGILRGLEAVAQSSLFRSAYELLFTPVVPAEKRSTKTMIDVGADRAGDIVGGALIRVVILLPVAVAENVLVTLAVVISLLSLLVARALHRGYVRALEKNLIHRGDALDLPPADAAGARTMMMDTFTGIDFSMTGATIRLDELRDILTAESGEAPAAAAEPPPTPSPLPPAPVDPEIGSLAELRSGDARRVHAELGRLRSMSPLVAGQVVTLLAWDEVSGWASRALAKSAPSITGQLVDRLLDTDEDFAVRRRIPRILSTCSTQRAVDGLAAALSDPRFEVRFQSARALARIHEQSPALVVARAVVFDAVLRETRFDRRLWDEPVLVDEPDAKDDAAALGTPARGRTNRRMEHVFTILSLAVPRAPLRVAFKGLLTTDAGLRGTSLEYLESVLPREIWSSLQPLLDDTRAPAAARPAEEALENLMRSSQSIDLNLEELRRKVGTDGT